MMTPFAVIICTFVLSSCLRADWPMAGANPQRTSWVPEQVPSQRELAGNRNGWLLPQWYRPIDAFIPPRVQIVAANRLLYVSTARGLYALREDGSLAWVYPTDMPLGHSPTIAQGVAYVGCFDARIHAVNALTGHLVGMSPAAGAGFQSNPLVVDGVVYAGSRDGYFYAWRLGRDGWEWRYPSLKEPPLAGPILYSAAYHKGDQVIYFAANDGHAYAVRQDGSLVWKSAQLPGEGFHSWWPVVHEDVVIISGSFRFRASASPRFGEGDLLGLQRDYIFPKGLPKGTLRGQRSANGWLDTSRSVRTSSGVIRSNSDYFEENPDHRAYLVLDRASGREIVYDFDEDGRPEYAPILWFGTHNGNRYPPIVGIDGNLYQANAYFSDDWNPGGHVTGWRKHTPQINTPVSRWLATDEPVAFSAGGNLIYWNHCCDRSGGAVDISVPNTSFPREDMSREWWYYSYNLNQLIPGYDVMVDGNSFSPHSGLPDFPGPYGGPNGVYQSHGDQNPPIPFNGRLYFHRSNAVLSFGVSNVTPASMPAIKSAGPSSSYLPSAAPEDLKNRLTSEVEKILDAGHLRPGWGHHGLLDYALDRQCGDQLSDYWHHPADIQLVLLQTLPHLSSAMQERVKDYLRNELRHYPPYVYTTVGWRDGVAREIFQMPEMEDKARLLFGPTEWGSSFPVWGTASPGGPRLPPYFYYALWKNAAVMGGATTLLSNSRGRLAAPPTDADLFKFPFVHNAYIAGYMGFLELEKLGGTTESPNVRRELNRLLMLRASTFSKDTPYKGNPIVTAEAYCRALTVSRNFLFMTRELAEYLRLTALNKVKEAIIEYERVAPYWFVAFAEAGIGENSFAMLYDRQLLLAKAWILKEPREALMKYLDVPAFVVGDLSYIQNLVATIEAAPGVASW